jgi:hypothetical protein
MTLPMILTPLLSQQGSELYALGDYFADFFESELKVRRKERHLKATDPDAIPTQEEKKHLDQLLLQTGIPPLLTTRSNLTLVADSDCLGVIINYLAKHSPDSLETVHVTTPYVTHDSSTHRPLRQVAELGDIVQMNVDAITPRIFREVLLIFESSDSQQKKQRR